MARANLHLLFFLLIFSGCVAKTTITDRLKNNENYPVPTLNITFSDPKNFSFGVVGDLHVEGQDVSRLERIINLANTNGESFLGLLGDIADTGVLSDYQAIQTKLTSMSWTQKFLPMVGNHDIFEDGATHYASVFGRYFYSVVVQGNRFIVLDTADGTLGPEQRNWFEAELKNTEENKFVFGHYPLAVPGQNTYLKFANRTEVQELLKLAANYRVRAWLSAHYHSFIAEKIHGVLHVIAGGGGKKRMPPFMQHFYAKIEVSPTDIRASAQVVE